MAGCSYRTTSHIAIGRLLVQQVAVLTSSNEMTDINRAIAMFGARGSSEQVEQDTALEVVGQVVMAREDACAERRAIEHSGMTPFRATSRFAELFAVGLGDRTLRHDMRVCDAGMFRMLWAARQAADMLGIPYGIYIDVGVRYLREMKGKKRITPRMLIASDVQLHMMDRWNAETSATRMDERRN